MPSNLFKVCQEKNNRKSRRCVFITKSAKSQQINVSKQYIHTSFRFFSPHPRLFTSFSRTFTPQLFIYLFLLHSHYSLLHWHESLPQSYCSFHNNHYSLLRSIKWLFINLSQDYLPHFHKVIFGPLLRDSVPRI